MVYGTLSPSWSLSSKGTHSLRSVTMLGNTGFSRVKSFKAGLRRLVTSMASSFSSSSSSASLLWFVNITHAVVSLF